MLFRSAVTSSGSWSSDTDESVMSSASMVSELLLSIFATAASNSALNWASLNVLLPDDVFFVSLFGTAMLLVALLFVWEELLCPAGNAFRRRERWKGNRCFSRLVTVG